MNKLKQTILTFLFCNLVPLTTVGAQEIIYYSGEFKLEENKTTITAHVSFLFKDFTNKDSIQFYLNNSAQIKAIRSNESDLTYTRKKSKEFLADVDSFMVPSDQLGPKEKKIEIWYSYELDSVQHPNFVHRPDWIELSLYTGWYPFNLDSTSFSYQIDFNLPAGYALLSKDEVEDNNGTWKIENNGSNKDLVCILSNSFKSVTSKDGSIAIHSIGFGDEQIAQLKKVTHEIHQLYEARFGKVSERTKLTILANSFNSPMSYARRNLISISMGKKIRPKDEEKIAHEIGHLWWNNAKYGSYEEWLNESFSEMSMLLWVEHKYGSKEVELKLSEYLSKSIDAPPIVFADPNHSTWYKTAYLKGALILWKFKKKIGTDNFFGLCRNISAKKIHTTEQLLVQVKEDLGKEYRNWLFGQISKSE